MSTSDEMSSAERAAMEAETAKLEQAHADQAAMEANTAELEAAHAAQDAADAAMEANTAELEAAHAAQDAADAAMEANTAELEAAHAAEEGTPEQAAMEANTAELERAHAEQAAAEAAMEANTAELERAHAEQAQMEANTAELEAAHAAQDAAEAAMEAETQRLEAAHAAQEAAVVDAAAQSAGQAAGQAGATAATPAGQVGASGGSRPSNSRIRWVVGMLALAFAITTFLLIQLLKANSNNAQPNVGGGQVHIVVNATESDGRKITFESTVRLTRDVVAGVEVDTLSGKGTGPYQEVFLSDQCGFTITWSGQVGVEVLARLADNRVQVGINGPVTENGTWPGAECLDGTYYSPNRGATELGYSCDFDNVDLTHAGTYLGPPPEEVPNPYGCKLDFKP